MDSLPLDVQRMGAAKCDKVGPRPTWDNEARRYSDKQSTDRSTGHPEWSGTFLVLGGTLEVSWAAPALDIAVGEIVTFSGLVARQAKSGRLYFTATSVAKAGK